jgi:hypothetical protein
MASFIKVMPQPYHKSVLPSIKPLGDDVSSRKNVSCELLHGKTCIIFKVGLEHFLFCIFVKCFSNDHFWTFAMKGYQYNFSIGRV